jgi:hypothetical protein
MLRVNHLIGFGRFAGGQLTSVPFASMSDNFNDNSTDLNKWIIEAPFGTDSLVTVQETSNHVLITPRSGQSGNHLNGYQSRLTYDLTDKFISIQLAQVGTADLSRRDAFGFQLGGANTVEFLVGITNTVFRKQVSGSADDVNATYDSTNHKYLRIRHYSSKDAIIFDVSADGIAWNFARAIARPFSITDVAFYFYGGTTQSVVSPGTVIFDDFVAGNAPTCFIDNFDDNSQDTGLWSKTSFFSNNASVTVVESGAVVTITPMSSTAGSNTNGYQAVNAYDMTGKYALVEVPTVTANDAAAQLRFGMLKDANNVFNFIKSANSWTFRVTTAGVASDTTLTYDATAHRWIKLLQSSTNILFQTSPDGATWTTRRTVANPSFGVTALKPFFLAGTTGSVASPGTAVFDNFFSDLA